MPRASYGVVGIKFLALAPSGSVLTSVQQVLYRLLRTEHGHAATCTAQLVCSAILKSANLSFQLRGRSNGDLVDVLLFHPFLKSSLPAWAALLSRLRCLSLKTSLDGLHVLHFAKMIAGEEQDNTDVLRIYVVRVGTKGYGLVALFRLKVE